MELQLWNQNVSLLVAHHNTSFNPGGKEGDKIHALTGSDRSIAAWQVAPMNKDERTITRRFIRDSSIEGELLGDGNYDSNPLHLRCEVKGNLPFVTPPRGGLGLKK